MKLPQLPLDRKTIRWLGPLAVAAAGVVSARAAWRRLTQRPLPPRQATVNLDVLQHPVEIIRDRWGVPHIYAQTEHDLFVAQGFVHAQDRLFQMDVNRRVGQGRVSEIVGPPGLASDRFARFAGWPRAAQAQVDGADATVRDMLAAFSAGVNAFIDQGNLPAEYTLLVLKPELWSAHATAAWGTVIAWGLSVNWETELLRLRLLETLGPEKALDLDPGYADAYDTVLPSSKVGKRQAARLMEAYRTALGYLRQAGMPLGPGMGSNNWTVSGTHTASGRPILANDPHLPPVFPTLWYENHLHAGKFHVTGFTMPGVPGVVIGHNEHVAWGVTNGFPDVQDVYLERFDPTDKQRYEVDGEWRTAELVTETIRVRGRKPVVETVRYTHRGPVISDMLIDEPRDFSLAWTSYARSNHLRAVVESNRARDWHEFREALRHWSFPSQNVVYADVEGNIGYMLPGLVPRRRRGDGLVPVPGWVSDYDWDGWLPFDDLPARFNPSEGMIATANNRVHGSDFAHLLTSEWLPGYRVARILELLHAYTPLTLADNGRIQSDTVSLQAQRFLRAALPKTADWRNLSAEMVWALRHLRDWNGDMRPDYVAPSLYFGWLVHLTNAAVAQAVGSEMSAELMGKRDEGGFPLYPFHEMSLELVLGWLEAGAPAWVGDIRPLLRPSLQKTIAVLRDHLGAQPSQWQWGRLHRVDLHNPLTVVPVLGRLWKPITLPVGGDGYTVNQSDVDPVFPPEPVHVIASCRMLIDVGAWDACLAALPGGQSAHVASEHYQDGVADWRDGRYHPMLFSRECVTEAAVGTIALLPTGKPLKPA